jgi:DNA polymerase III epsilon subunit-like protein
VFPKRLCLIAFFLSLLSHAHGPCEQDLLIDQVLREHGQDFKNRLYKSPKDFAENRAAYDALLASHAKHLELVRNLHAQDPASLSPFLKQLQARLEQFDPHSPSFFALDSETTGFSWHDKVTEFAIVPVDEKLSIHTAWPSLYSSGYLDIADLPQIRINKALLGLPEEVTPELRGRLLKMASKAGLEKKKHEGVLKDFQALYPDVEKNKDLWNLRIKELVRAFSIQTALVLNNYFNPPANLERLDSELALTRRISAFMASSSPVLIGQNIPFDIQKLSEMLGRAHTITQQSSFLELQARLGSFKFIDTKQLFKLFFGRLLYARYFAERTEGLLPRTESKAEFMADLFKVDASQWHGALFDSRGTVEILLHILALDMDLYVWLQELKSSKPEVHAQVVEELQRVEASFKLPELLHSAKNPYNQAHRLIYPGAKKPAKKKSAAKEDDEPEVKESNLWLNAIPLPI